MTRDILSLKDRSQLLRIGAVATWAQLLIILVYAVLMGFIGPRVQSAEEFIAVFESSKALSLLRIDLLLMFLIAAYLFNLPAFLLALWRTNAVICIFAGLFTVIAVTLSFAGEATLSLYHLGQRMQDMGLDERRGLLAAADGLLAAGWWHSSASYMTGITLQGAGILFSLLMLWNPRFSNVTAIAGLTGNSFDMLQHLISPFAPEVASYFSFAMVAYLLWYPMLGRDLWRVSKEPSEI